MSQNSLTRAIELLRQAVQDGSMQNASFDELHVPMPIVLNNREEVNAYIKQRIDLWLRTWVVGPAKSALEILESDHELVASSDALEQALNGDTELGRAIERMHAAMKQSRRF